MFELVLVPFVVLGVVSAVWPYRVARFEERVDAIGSKRSWDEVEPTDSRVGLTRVLGVLVAVGGYLAMWVLGSA